MTAESVKVALLSVTTSCSFPGHFTVSCQRERSGVLATLAEPGRSNDRDLKTTVPHTETHQTFTADTAIVT